MNRNFRIVTTSVLGLVFRHKGRHMMNRFAFVTRAAFLICAAQMFVPLPAAAVPFSATLLVEALATNSSVSGGVSRNSTGSGPISDAASTGGGNGVRSQRPRRPCMTPKALRWRTTARTTHNPSSGRQAARRNPRRMSFCSHWQSCMSLLRPGTYFGSGRAVPVAAMSGG